ncbi:hypothetical protein HBH98_093970 [Parastagonospora nodorum]|nr:hypothetical protein HBH52_200390 [Parastagonospora nodorum]KAH3973487.1 hypothetical protein HBH51_098980 [Parastagonospora nodorum]KAH4291142.1 hypothetical protein HBI01_192050 [Parastagonospora nodorum]KAH4307643.1 hypothetical protein HBI02_110590 [Parastagonospora nodorum]KAH4322848.1 hypothetical protein HBI00_189680 [Parastagonospora nodorum]
MGIFHRSSSSSSRFSTTFSSASDSATPRTSIDSNNDSLDDTSAVKTTILEKPKAPLLSLPVELVQHVTSYLEAESSASFCLSSRYIYYALGSDCLTQYINSSKNRFAKRRTIEAIVERAFPGHWFCAWCDVFHAWSPSTSPSNPRESLKPRDCAEFNSYLSAGSEYNLRFHHIHLALSHALHGPDHGIPISSLAYTRSNMAKIYRTPVPTSLTITPRISSSHTLLLHTSFAIILPSFSTSRKHILAQIWPVFPHILSGHRDSENGHSGLMAAVDNVVRRGWKYPFTQSCSTCRTDWSVSAHFFGHASGGQLRLVVQTWRDVGDGKSPFDQGWRSHGVGLLRAEASGLVRNLDARAGDVRREFDLCGQGGVGVKRASEAREDKGRIYQAFMGQEVRRSRARPSVWRTRSENEEVARREEEERVEVARQNVERLIREDTQRGRRY